MIDNNLAWVPWLATLFETGRMARFIDNSRKVVEDEAAQAAGEPATGKVINSRITKISNLSNTEKFFLLSNMRKNVPKPAEVIDITFYDKALNHILHKHDFTPWPAEPKSHHINILAAICKQRASDCGDRKIDDDFAQLSANDFEFWKAGNNGNSMKCTITQEDLVLPNSSDGEEAQWSLSDPFDWECEATSEMPRWKGCSDQAG